MDKYQFIRWRDNEVTQEIKQDLTKYVDLLIEELLSFKPGAQNLAESHFYLKGKIDGIKEFLTYEIEDDNEV